MFNAYHPTGKHKAVVFKSMLGIDALDALLLKDAMLHGLGNNECAEDETDAFETRYSVKMNIRIFEREATIVTSWIIKTGEDFPRLTSCYIKTKK